MGEKFKEFYFTGDQRIHNLDELEKEYEQKSGDISSYRGRICCPECRIAELAFTHKTSKKRAFLSTLPSSDHMADCSLKYESVSRKEIKDYVSNLGEEEMQDRLEAMLNRMLLREREENQIPANDVGDNPFTILVRKEGQPNTRKCIPRKSLNSWFDKDEENNIFLFYGSVHLEVKEIETKWGTRYKLIVKTNQQGEWKTKTTIFRGENRDEIDQHQNYDLAIIGQLEFYNKLSQIKTVSRSSIMFRIRQE
ncbi:hypothetical protein HMPREF3108_06860 [Streptococcus sp. HMSC10A01]|uniref:hypothetical protein n=1 Tax=Streptococcus sp. HMSC10A01 TaxID=1581076 RepID=UPI0008A1D065|nr:hypothetical protein [Streptococcus sp. HMSC10A01]OFU70515.1 hypothetical protein HMPREF3108_06860 [Streptococcus sp. HMSC10A01]